MVHLECCTLIPELQPSSTAWPGSLELLLAAIPHGFGYCKPKPMRIRGSRRCTIGGLCLPELCALGEQMLGRSGDSISSHRELERRSVSKEIEQKLES